MNFSSNRLENDVVFFDQHQKKKSKDMNKYHHRKGGRDNAMKGAEAGAADWGDKQSSRKQGKQYNRSPNYDDNVPAKRRKGDRRDAGQYRVGWGKGPIIPVCCTRYTII